MIAQYQCTDFACAKQRTIVAPADVRVSCSCGELMARVLFDARRGRTDVAYVPGSLGQGRESSGS